MASGYSVAITATDKATAVIDRINARFGAINKSTLQVTAAGQRFGASLSRLGQTTGINQIGAGLNRVSQSIGAAVEGLGRFAPALAGITGAASLAGIARLTTSWSEFGSKLGFDSRRIGIAASSLHALQGASRLAGGSAEGLTDGLQTLGDNLVNAVGGRAPEFVMLMNTLGLSFRNAQTGGARLAEDVLPEIADRIAAIRNPTLQARAAVMAFGGAGEAMLPFLRRGAAGLEEYNAAARAYGVQNGAGVEAARAFREEQTRLSLAVEGVGYGVSEKLAPVLTKMLRELSDWVAGNRNDVVGFFGDMADRFDAWRKNFDWAGMKQGLTEFATDINGVVNALGGWGRAVEVIIGLKLLGWVMNLLGPLGKLVSLLALIPGSGVAGAAAVVLGTGGAAAGKQNVPMVDDNGRPIGNWGGAEGERNAGAGRAETPGWRPGLGYILGRIFGGGGGGSAPNGVPRVGPTFGAQGSTVDSSLTPGMRGLLDTIAGPESGGRYNVSNGGATFSDMSRHPGYLGGKSTAAGRYQFVQGTWEEARKALNLQDFSPASQDKAAAWLAARDYGRSTGRDLQGDLNSPDPKVRAGIGGALHKTWSSLPGGVEQTTTSDRFLSNLDAGKKRYSDEMVPMRVAPAPNVAPAPAPGGAGAPGASGSVDLNVYHHNPPPGTRSEVNTRGDVTYNGPRVDGAMAVP